MPDFPAGSRWPDAIRALEPLLAAERERGNRGRLDFGDARDNRPGYRMRHPLDLDALTAQFAFGEGIELIEGTTRGIQFRGRAGYAVFSIGGGGPGLFHRIRSQRWWRAWTSSPRPREPFENPFAELIA